LAQVDGLSVERMHRYGWRSGADLDPEILRGDRSGSKDSSRYRCGERKSVEQRTGWKDHRDYSTRVNLR
jgi:hypothetical protein